MKDKYQIAFPILGAEEKRNLMDCIDSGWIPSRGKYIEKFEKEFAKFCGTRYAVAVSNGTVALTLSLMAIGIRPGDEVTIPDLTFGATANAAKMLGAKPVLVDVDRNTWNIDPKEIEKNISKRTKAIIVVHLYGLPCAMDRIKKIARRHNLKVIEDAAEAHGAIFKGKVVGGLGDIGCFSFFGNKIITTGEGGMCTTNDRLIYEKMVIMKNHGMGPGRKYWHEVTGGNFRMTNMQAAIGLAQMKKIRGFVRQKIQIARWYKKEIKKQGLDVEYQREVSGASSVWWMFTVLFGGRKNTGQIMESLAKEEIDSRPIFIPLSLMPAFKNLRRSKRLVNSIEMGRSGVTLPSNLKLKKGDVSFIISRLKRYAN